MGTSALCHVTVELKDTHLHEFPDVLRTDIPKIVKGIGASANTLTIVGVIGACLTIPIRNVRSILVDKEVVWKSLTE